MPTTSGTNPRKPASTTEGADPNSAETFRESELDDHRRKGVGEQPQKELDRKENMITPPETDTITKRSGRATPEETVRLPGGAESGVSPAADMTPAVGEDEHGNALDGGEPLGGPRENIGPMASGNAAQGVDKASTDK